MLLDPLHYDLAGDVGMEHIASGETVEAAVEKALAEKGWKRSDIDVEVLQPEKKIWLFRRPAVVRVIHKAGVGQGAGEQEAAPALDQLASAAPPAADDVKWNGSELYMAPHLFETYEEVVLIPSSPGQLLVNGEEISGATPLSPDDRVSLANVDFDLKEWLLIETDQRGLEATILLAKEGAYEVKHEVRPLRDRLEVRFRRVLRNSLPWTTGDVVTLLHQKGIVYGIDYQRIEAWLQGEFKRFQPWVVARGKEQQDGQPTQFVKLYAPPFSEETSENEEDAIDWFGAQFVESVEAGEAIVEVIPATKGINGTNLYGEPIIARDGREIPVKLGQGVELSPDGRFVKATVAGRPEVYKGRVSVHPIHIVNGDLTLEIGSIQFNGDVLVRGDVLEGLAIEATGNVSVTGSVVSGEIVAGQHVRIGKNVIKSRIVAGGEMAPYKLLASKMRQLNDQLSQLISACHQLEREGAAQLASGPEFGRLTKLLLDSRFQNIGKTIRTLHQDYRKMELRHKPVGQWLEQLIEKLTRLGPLTLHSVSQLEALYQQGTELQAGLEPREDQSADVSASYIHNSTVQAYGNIYVRGSGVYNSQLKARDEIHVEGKPGIVRGGYLEASKKINAQEIGVRSGVRCELVIRDADGEVEAGHLNIGVTVVINGVHFKNQHDVQGARLWYDPEAHAVKMTRQE